jgi:hypothetical protein
MIQENTIWLIAGFMALPIYLNGILIQMGFPDPFADLDVWDDRPQGPNINDYHDEDQPEAGKKRTIVWNDGQAWLCFYESDKRLRGAGFA